MFPGCWLDARWIFVGSSLDVRGLVKLSLALDFNWIFNTRWMLTAVQRNSYVFSILIGLTLNVYWMVSGLSMDYGWMLVG